MLKLEDYQWRAYWAQFNDGVKSNKYKPIEYQDWKNLNKAQEVRIDTAGNNIIIYTEEAAFFFPIEESDGFGGYIFKKFFNKKENMEVKENKMKNFNFDFGTCSDDSVRMSMYGLAIKNANGVYVSYNPTTQQIIDVDIMNFEGGKYMFKMPVALKAIAVGDVVIHNRKPMFVTAVNRAGNDLTVIDVYNGEKKEIIPTTNMFNFNFVTKVISLFSMGTPTEDMPFGNMLPFLLMNEDKDFDPMMMLFAMNGNSNMNPAMFFLLKDFDSNNDMIKMMLLSSMMNGGNGFFPMNGFNSTANYGLNGMPIGETKESESNPTT